MDRGWRYRIQSTVDLRTLAYRPLRARCLCCASSEQYL